MDCWVTAAVTDDQMVAALLLRLKLAKTTAEMNTETPLPPLGWGIRQKRSRPSRFVGVSGGSVKGADSVRGSPTTPLSWSGGSSSSGGSAYPSAAATADGFEEISLQASCSTSAGSGSKAFPSSETTSPFSKRSKRKKTFSQLKDEENFLLKERLNLEKEIATMRTTVMEHSARNQNLKRIKVELNSDCVRSAIRDDLTRKPSTMIHSRKRKTWPVKEEPISDPCRDGGFFMLPDLNMTPLEDDVCTDTLYGTILTTTFCQNT